MRVVGLSVEFLDEIVESVHGDVLGQFIVDDPLVEELLEDALASVDDGVLVHLAEVLVGEFVIDLLLDLEEHLEEVLVFGDGLEELVDHFGDALEHLECRRPRLVE